MDKTLGLLDRLPAKVRHAIIAGGAAAGGTVCKAVIAKQGVSGVNWGEAMRNALDNGCLAGAVALMALYFTPLTRQYGVFKK